MHDWWSVQAKQHFMLFYHAWLITILGVKRKRQRCILSPVLQQLQLLQYCLSMTFCIQSEWQKGNPLQIQAVQNVVAPHSSRRVIYVPARQISPVKLILCPTPKPLTHLRLPANILAEWKSYLLTIYLGHLGHSWHPPPPPPILMSSLGYVLQLTVIYHHWCSGLPVR